MTDPEVVVVQHLREANWLHCAYHFVRYHLVELHWRRSLLHCLLAEDLPVRQRKIPHFLMHGCDLS